MIDLQLLGNLVLDGPGLSPAARARRRHPLALLALVAASAPQTVARERIMAFLWPESDSDRASNSLRQTLFWLRRDLGEDLFLPDTAGGLQLDPARIRVDLWAFRDAVGRQAPVDAVGAYRGPFLDGFQVPESSEFSQWVEAERSRLHRLHISALETLSRQAEEQGRCDDAVLWRRRQAAADPYSSRAALALLRALAAAGDRTGALEYATVYENLVRLHLDAEPDPAVAEFVAGLRAAPAAAEKHATRERPSEPAPVLAPAEPAMSDATRPRRISRPAAPWVVAAALLLALLVISGRSTFMGWIGMGDEGTTIVLASGARPVAGRDPATRLIRCSGPACPPGALPQDAFVVPKHSSYGSLAAGTSFIAPVANATINSSPGFACCTTATFEHVFALPPTAVAARIVLSVLADNQVSAAVNGLEFGSQPDQWEAANYLDTTTFSITFAPDPGGTNRLLLTLWDGGGALGLYYHAAVTYELAPDTPPRAK